ncbi:MAG TPA: hypothetical protein VJM33_19270 [Microthrixaceae bacterium]|nr:hypothetical protein [Microthrixaceae bacterium]
MAGVLASFALFATQAGGQEEPTTTIEEPTTTTEFVPPPDVTTTTEPIVLPGEHIDGGSLILGARFENTPGSDCQVEGSLVGQQMNLIRHETGMIGAVYGKADLGGGQLGLVMVQLGPLPTAVIAYRAMGTCNQDMVGMGGFSSTDTGARFEGIGYGLFPGDFANFVTADVTVTASGGEPSLDIQAAYDFLAQERPETP